MSISANEAEDIGGLGSSRAWRTQPMQKLQDRAALGEGAGCTICRRDDPRIAKAKFYVAVAIRWNDLLHKVISLRLASN
jgi:hypothetical protein